MPLCICWGGLVFRICMNSWVDLILYLFGIYGTVILFRILDRWYMGVGICERISLIGLPCLWVFILPYHHHRHVVLVARISLTLSRHFSLSFIASSRSSELHPISSHSCWMYVRAARPAFAWPCVGVHYHILVHYNFVRVKH